MFSCTDTFNFNNSEMFAKIRAGLPSDKTKTQNLIECKDDLLFAWDSSKCCLLVLNWRAAKVKGFDEIKYQTLVPSKQRNFQVDKILASPEGSLIALAGTNGLSIVELPSRWGPNGYFLEGKDEIICRSYNLHEDVFENNSHLQLLQIRWHPASPTDSHILALLSDNTICVYDESTLKHIWRIGPLPCIQQPLTLGIASATKTTTTTTVQSSSTVSLLYSLGEAAVDFDIAPPRVVSSYNDNDTTTMTMNTKNIIDSRINNSTYVANGGNESSTSLFGGGGGVGSSNGVNSGDTIVNGKGNNANEIGNNNNSMKSLGKVEWPIVILRGNGNIYVLCAGIDTERPKLQGPLTIQPQTEDNYGVDSCSILVIPSLPPALIIAESTGKLHHALMLEAETKKESFSEIDSSLIVHPSEWTIHVLETVELELGLLENSKKTKSHTCPIYLKRDFINEFRYFAYHNTGLHVIFMNFVKQLQRFVSIEDTTNDAFVLLPSTSEYIVCTKVENQNRINAVLGFVLLQMPSGIVLLLSSGQVISLNIIIDPNLLPDWNIRNDKESQQQQHLYQHKIPSDSLIQKIMGESFVTHIQNILRKDVTQPILSLDKTTEPTIQECYELLAQAKQVLYENYFKKHEKARAEIIKRIQLLKSLKEKQRKEIEYLENQKEQIQNDAERLAEKCEDINDKQQILFRKCQELLRQANISLPSNTLADKEFVEEVEKINEKSLKMETTLQKIKEKLQTQIYHIHKYTETTTNNELFLPSKQETAIKEILSQITKEIDSQIKETKRILNIINLPS